MTTFGALCPLLDKTDAALDHLQEACKEAGLQLGDQINVWINVAADNMFDQVAYTNQLFLISLLNFYYVGSRIKTNMKFPPTSGKHQMI